MSLQPILEKIRATGESQIQEIEKDAQAKSNEILARARMEAEQVEEDACADTSSPAVAERARIIHRARLESLHIVGTVRENLVDTAISRMREQLATSRSDSAYPTVLRALVEESLTQLNASEGKGNFQLLADPRDKKLLDKILKDLKLNTLVRYELNCWGGVTAQSEDGRVVVINTLEARLNQATPFLRQHLASTFEASSSSLRGEAEAISQT
jgi:vacuolar-type H+-ATPase subunit E/Vma4